MSAATGASAGRSLATIAIGLVIALAGADHPVNTAFAWTYVALRIAHSLVQATVNKIAWRFPLFLASTLVLFALAIIALMRTLG